MYVRLLTDSYYVIIKWKNIFNMLIYLKNTNIQDTIYFVFTDLLGPNLSQTQV